tara:strand:+ start:6059 stop:6643 length:585 start_codon:yes stop_codon:yes gene_type:complete
VKLIEVILKSYGEQQENKMYKPSDDSFLFAQFLKDYLSKLKNKNISYLDMGTGSGILAETAKKSKVKNILAVDIDKETVDYVKQKGIKAIQSNLFSKIPKTKKFGLITFNAPYLPKDKKEPKESQKATTGGKKGDEISIKFLKQAKKHLTKDGKIFLLISSLTPQNKIKKFKPRIVKTKKMFFEQLLILRFNRF